MTEPGWHLETPDYPGASAVAFHRAYPPVPADFQPRKVVFAIMAERALTSDALFLFVQIALTHVTRILKGRHSVDVEVVSIPLSASEQASAGAEAA